MYSREKLLKVAKENKGYFTTIRIWDIYAREKDLPKSNHFIRCFGRWRAALLRVHGDDVMGIHEQKAIRVKYTRKDLVAVAKKHSKYFTSKNSWDVFASENKLPNSWIYIRNYGDWTTAKREIFGDHIPVKKISRDKNRLIMIAKNHSEHFTSKTEWNNYARELSLPTVSTYVTCFGSWGTAKDEIFGMAFSVISTENAGEHFDAVSKEHFDAVSTEQIELLKKLYSLSVKGLQLAKGIENAGEHFDILNKEQIELLKKMYSLSIKGLQVSTGIDADVELTSLNNGIKRLFPKYIEELIKG